ncbi:MAG: ABC transporter ATP-binding protein [Anaerolineales bacterium]|nr:ABC transporter ATP-binding protein [Anaerolineales bacterium]
MIERSAKRPSLLRLLDLLKPKQGKYLLGLFGRVALSTIERLYIAYVAKLSLDAMVGGTLDEFGATLIQWVVFYLGYLVIAPFVLYVWRSAIYEGTARIRARVFEHLQRLPLGYHERHHSGDALSTLTNDVATAERAYQDDLMMLCEATAQGLSAAIFMLWLSWPLTLMIVLASLMPLIINTLFAKPLRQIGDAVQSELGGLTERMTDLLAGYAVVRSFNLGDWILERFEGANGRVREHALRRVRTEAALAAANDFGGIFNLLSMAIGAYMVLIGQTTIGVLIGLVQLSNQISYFVYSIGGTVSRIQTALAAADRVLKVLDEPVEPDRYALPEAGAAANAPGAQIAFEGVDFAYNGDDPVLQGVSFQAASGQVVAFAGPSGGGKSTIFKLLLGCYPIRSGAVWVDGQDLRALRLADLRQRIAYVPQDAFLFAGTIYDNIRYGKPGASQAEIEAAARAAFAHDFISDFPEGYQTVVGERGARLSGGQRQRIAIARALLKDAPILLLDEATSALDSESEQVVHQALEALMRGRTTLVIAHRLSTILNADQIVVIDDGRVAEAGRHPELLARKGVYANLFDLQYRAGG